MFEKGVELLYLNVKKSLTTTALMTSSSTLLLGLASTGIMGIGGYFIMGGTLTMGDFIAFTLFLGFMIAPIVQMGNIGSQLTEAMAGLDRTEELMNMPEEDDPSIRTIRLKDITGNMVFDDVSFAYEENKEVLHNISFKAPKAYNSSKSFFSASRHANACAIILISALKCSSFSSHKPTS